MPAGFSFLASVTPYVSLFSFQFHSLTAICSRPRPAVTHRDGKFNAQLSKLTAIGRTRHDEL